MKHKLRARALALALMIGLTAGMLPPPAGAQEGAMEEAIVYDNDVVATIDPQLSGQDLAAIRQLAGLILDQDIEDIQAAISRGALSYEQLTAFYLDRIRRLDKGEGGINALITVNPKAIGEARARDAKKPTERGLLYGMPILLKDNINTADMATSAGTLALKDFYPAEDAPVVQRLKAEGAIILGKANLSELANFVDFNMPNGYSSRVGQTLNPLNPGMISPLGSSAGSAAAVALNLCAASLGTETTGSIIAPAYIHSLVGLKPGKGRISTEGVLPLSSTMDVVGPIARSVKDAVALYNASVSDSAARIALDPAYSLKGRRIGLLKGQESSRLAQALKEQGAEVIELNWAHIDQDNSFIIEEDFDRDFQAYAAKWNAPVKSLKELVDFNKQDLKRRAKYGQALIELAARTKKGDDSEAKEMVQETQAEIRKMLSEHRLDALAYINDQACALPAIAGFPTVTIPFGQSHNSIEPLGASFFSDAGTEQQLMNLAHAFERGAGQRLKVMSQSLQQ